MVLTLTQTSRDLHLGRYTVRTSSKKDTNKSLVRVRVRVKG